MIGDASAHPGAKVYIVDDDESICKALKRLLKPAGYFVESFSSAEEFLASADEADCLILDLRLPKMSGLDLFEHLASTGCGVPTVFISAYSSDQDRKRALQDGAIAFLEKPFEHEALLAAVRKALRIDS